MDIIQRENISISCLLDSLMNTKRKKGNNLEKKRDLINTVNKIIQFRKFKTKAKK